VADDKVVWRVADEVSGDRRRRGARRRRGRCGGATGAGEELGQPQHAEVDEYAGQREREELGAQQPVPVDDVPGLADAATRGQAARRQAAEHVHEHVLGQRLHVAWLTCCSSISVSIDFYL